jgi:hypothetical protein
MKTNNQRTIFSSSSLLMALGLLALSFWSAAPASAQARSWGWNSSGQLGDGTTLNALRPSTSARRK